LAYVVWAAGFYIAYLQVKKAIAGFDGYLYAVVALLTGWGLLTIWRLTSVFGMRQMLWLVVGLVVLVYGVRHPAILLFLRRYKYVWLTSGLLLIAVTLFFGTNPMGNGPRLWFGCCGVYFQPSELLKLLLIVYLAGYLSDYDELIAKISRDLKRTSGLWKRFRLVLPILAPVTLMTGISILLLVVQKDLGTASIFIFIYTMMIFIATGWKWVPLVSLGGILFTGFLGFQLIDVVRARIETWINPWLDPSGKSYQVVQALISIANGGILGRGFGLGSPTLVPIAHSDFVFTAIAEETGLFGTIAVLVLLAIFAQRGIRIALLATNTFHRYLAAGLTVNILVQSILIISGNMRLLPLTGVTLPFLSYGGSSLLVSFLSLLLLFLIADEYQPASSQGRNPPLLAVSSFLLISLAVIAVVNGWWAVYRGPSLLTRTDNPRRMIAEKFVRRGALLDRYDSVMVETFGSPGDYHRVAHYPYGTLFGYDDAVFGQSGLEASLDAYLRGIEGVDPWTLWQYHLLYGTPPPGLDVRLTIDLSLQREAQEMFTGRKGALILVNAESGEIYAMVSSPEFSPNHFGEKFDLLVQDENSPLLNRVTQGQYGFDKLSEVLQFGNHGEMVSIAVPPFRFQDVLSSANQDVLSPLQAVIAAATLCNKGISPPLRIALAVREHGKDWVSLPSLSSPQGVATETYAYLLNQPIVTHDADFWYLTDVPENKSVTWFIGGTLPDVVEVPFAVALVLEENNPNLARYIGQKILSQAIYP